jgi:hypothetical protein
MAYSVLGDSVNFAARLESLNKQTGTRMLISDEVAMKTNNVFLHRLLFPVQVVGKEEAVKIYETVGIRPSLLLESVLGGDEASQSMSFALSTSKSMSMSNAISHVGHVSRRKQAQITARSIIERAMALREATVVASEAEAKFVFDYNAVAQMFCDEDGEGCLQALAKLRTTYPAFFNEKGDITELRRICGEERCEAFLIRADVSASKLEKIVKRVIKERNETGGGDNNNNNMVENQSFNGMFRSNSGFVFKPEEK